MTDDLRTLRARVEAIEAELARRLAPPPGRTPARAVQVVQGPDYVASAPRFFLARPVELTAADAEGALATARASEVDWAVRVLRSAPSAGEVLIARGTDHRWHAERGDGGGGPPPPDGCRRVAKVVGCGSPSLPIPGATIRWTPFVSPGVLGTPISGTTDTNGEFAVDYTITGGIWEVDAYCGFRRLVRVDPFPCDSPTLALGPDDDHVCTACSRWPVKRVLSFTCDKGSGTVTAASWPSASAWLGSYSFTGRRVSAPTAFLSCACPPGVNGGQPNTPVRLDVDAGGTLTVDLMLECLGTEWRVSFGRVTPYAGLTACAACDWGYIQDSPLWRTNFVPMACGAGYYSSTPGTVAIACGSAAISGSFGGGCSATVIEGTCTDPRVTPTQEECAVSMSDHPVGSYAFTGA